jgi:hypothetical protein
MKNFSSSQILSGNRHFDTGHPSQRFALDDTHGQLEDLAGAEQPYFLLQSYVPSIVNRIKAEASLWIAAGTKCLATFFCARVISCLLAS